MTDTVGVRVPATLRDIAKGRSLSPGFVHAVTLVADVAAIALEGIGYKPMMPALMPPLPRTSAPGSIPASQGLQVTRVFTKWLERGERLPLRYHLLWPMPSGEKGKLAVDIGAHCALADETDVADQLAADARAMACVATALCLPFVGGEQLPAGDGESCVTTAFYITGPDGVSIPFATCTRDRTGNERPWTLRLPQPNGRTVHQTSLRIALTMLTDLFLDFNPDMESY
jgi:hypothetical protein